MRNMPGPFPNFNPANLPGLANRSTSSSPPVSSGFDPKISSPISAALLNAHKQHTEQVAQEAAQRAEAEANHVTPEKRSSTPANPQNGNAGTAAAAAIMGRLFAGNSANMGAKLQVNGNLLILFKSKMSFFVPSDSEANFDMHQDYESKMRE